jgi:two-component system cell cycle sensor histidine kinase PleC
VGVALDVSDERTAQARVQAAEGRLRDAIENVSDAFVLWDSRGRLLMSNRTFRDFFALDAELLKPACGGRRCRARRWTRSPAASPAPTG